MQNNNENKEENSQIAILDVLNERKPCGHKEIHEKAKLHPRTVTKNLKKLIDKKEIFVDKYKSYSITEMGITSLRRLQNTASFKPTEAFLFSSSPPFNTKTSTAFFELNPETTLNEKEIQNLQEKFEKEIPKIMGDFSNKFKKVEIILGFTDNKKSLS